MTYDPILDVEEARLQLNYSARTVREKLRKGELRGSQAGPKGKWQIRQSAIDQYIADRQNVQSPGPIESAKSVEVEGVIPQIRPELVQPELEWQAKGQFAEQPDSDKTEAQWVFRQSNLILSEEDVDSLLTELEVNHEYKGSHLWKLKDFRSFMERHQSKYLDLDFNGLYIPFSEFKRELFGLELRLDTMRSTYSDFVLVGGARSADGEVTDTRYAFQPYRCRRIEGEERECVFLECTKELQRRVNEVREAYRAYRASVKETLHL